MKNDKAAAAYCRVAHMDDLAIEVQKKRVLQYASEQGYDDITEYIDNGASGLDFNRPAFSQMCADIKDGKINIIFINSISRLGRNIVNVGAWLNEMKKLHIDVKALDGSCQDVAIPEIESLIKALAKGKKRQRKSS